MIRLRAALTMAAVGALLAACGEAGSPDSEQQTVDAELLLYCGEARGALLELTWALEGRERVDTSKIDHGPTRMRWLAEKTSASDAVRQDFQRWDAAVQAWLDGIRAIPPRFEAGRVIEPDTTALDRRLIADLGPVSQRLAGWVRSVCGEPPLQIEIS
jgi:hypothetical protein